MTHSRGLSSLDLGNLDVETGSNSTSIESDYFRGLPILKTFQEARLPWTSTGPTTFGSRSGGGGDGTRSAGNLGVLASLRAHGNWAKAGWLDSIRLQELVKVVSSSASIRMTIIKGLVLSLAVAILIFFFELAFIPGHLYSSNYHDDHHDYEESSNAHVLWLYPVVAISYFAASSWTSEVATTAYKMKHGRGQSMAALVTSPNTRRRIFLESFRLILIANYLGFAIGLQWIPWIGRTLSFFFVSFVDAYYCFDGVLATRGWSVEARLRFVESRWAYMTTFGLIPTLVSYFHPSGLLNLFLFMAVYPFFTVLALMAQPQPRSIPGAGTAPPSTNVFADTSYEDRKRETSLPAGSELSPFLPGRIPFFLPTVVLYRLVMKWAPLERIEDEWTAADQKPNGGYTGYSRSASPAFANGATSIAMCRGPSYGTMSDGQGVYSSATSSTEGGPGLMSGGRRTAAQVVGGAWNASPRLGNTGGWSTPPPMGGQQYQQAFVGGQEGASSPQGGPPPPPPPMGGARGITGLASKASGISSGSTGGAAIRGGATQASNKGKKSD